MEDLLYVVEITIDLIPQFESEWSAVFNSPKMIFLALILLIYRYVIVKHVRKDHLEELPVPNRIKIYLNTPFYYSEQVTTTTTPPPFYLMFALIAYGHALVIAFSVLKGLSHDSEMGGKGWYDWESKIFR